MHLPRCLCFFIAVHETHIRVETGSVPLIRMVIWVRPRFDPDMTRLNKETLVEGSSLSLESMLYTQSNTQLRTL